MLQRFEQPLPLSLYIHIPWCVRKCPYCDFNSHESKTKIPEAAYIDALLRDLENDVPRIWGRRISSIFFGGGTPSIFSAAGIDRLLSGVRALVPFLGNIEITLEANPGTVDVNKFRDLRNAGINRLSIGIQSFHQAQLQALGRIHNELDARRAADWAREAGFENFNLDLMHGLPGQTVSMAMRDLQLAIASAPTHLSWYQLTIEPNTRFAFDPPALPDDDTLSDIQDEGLSVLHDSGFARYEISAYARAGQTCQHNINYWQFGDYLGIGAGAHSKITDLQQQRAYRLMKKKHPQDYLRDENGFIASESTINADDMPFEFMMNALRLHDGVPKAYYEARTGLSLNALQPVLDWAIQKEYLLPDLHTLRTTESGFRFLNNVLELFLADNLRKYGAKKIIPLHAAYDHD